MIEIPNNENKNNNNINIENIPNKLIYEYFEIVDELKKTNNNCVCFNTNGKFQSSFREKEY